MNANNNAILFVFGLFFVGLGIIAPLVTGEFGGTVIDNGADTIEPQFNQLNGSDVGTVTQGISLFGLILKIVWSILFWTFGLPLWLNIVLLMMKITYAIIIVGKITGNG